MNEATPGYDNAMQTILRFFVFWALNCVTLWIVSKLTPAISFTGIEALLLAGLVFGLVNTFIKPVLLLLTLPLTLVTLGLFILVLNTLILFFVGWIVPGFETSTFWHTLFAAFGVSIVSIVLNAIFAPRLNQVVRKS